MREMKDSGISWVGEIPLQWNVYRNKDGFINTKTIVGKNSKNTPLLSLTTKGIKLKDIDNPEGKQPESFDTYQCVEINDLVMCLFDLDISAVFSGLSSYNGMISPAYKVLKCNERVIAKYADYWFRYIFDGRKFNQYAKNIRYTLTYDVFSALPMLYPSVEEQQNIADYLDTKCTQIDTIIAKEQSVIEKLQEYRQSIITETVVRGLSTNVLFQPINCEWIDMIPDGWNLIKFGMITNIKSNLVSPLDYPSLLQISPENIEKDTGNIFGIKTVRETGIISDNHLFNKGQIIYSKVRPTLNKVIIADFDGLCSADMYPIETIVNVKYLVYFMRSKLFVSQVDRISSDRVKMPKINKMELRQLFCFIPSEEEQKRIVELLDSKCNKIDKVILEKQVLIDKLIEYKKSLIYEIVTGKKEVPHV